MKFRFKYFSCKIFPLILNELQKRLGENVGHIEKRYTFEYSIKQSHIMNARRNIKTTAELRQATQADFKVGTTLVSPSYSFTIVEKYADGMWNAKGTEGQGCKVVYEGQSSIYKVAINTHETL
jgi:hypothetical protein